MKEEVTDSLEKVKGQADKSCGVCNMDEKEGIAFHYGLCPFFIGF